MTQGITPVGAAIASTETQEGPSLQERKEAFIARMRGEEPVASEASEESAVEDGEGPGEYVEEREAPADDEEPATKPDKPARKAKPAADEEPPIDRIERVEREAIKRRKDAQDKEREADTLYADIRRQSEQLRRDREQFIAAQQRLATPEGVLEWFEARGGDPSAIHDYIIAASDPTKRAVLEAKRAVDPVQKRLDDMQAKIDQYEANQQQQQALVSFRAAVSASDAEANPHTSAMLTSDPDYLAECATAAAQQLHSRQDAYGRPKPFDYDDVIAQIEQRLQREATRFANKSNGAGAAKVQPKSSPKTPARVPASTITQRDQGARTAVTQGQEVHELSLDERRQLAKARRATG